MEYKNVLGTELINCSCNPLTGWYRDGSCKTDQSDYGRHTICALMTKSFLSYSKAQGNDLSTPAPQHNFPGLKEGDYWCLCASRWKQAYDDGFAPLVHLEATEISTLSIVNLNLLKRFDSKANTN
tara:strand:- start:1030 stop:1404 length:375 start_codon:yes stop_codon:yes gene_type:complete